MQSSHTCGATPSPCSRCCSDSHHRSWLLLTTRHLNAVNTVMQLATWLLPMMLAGLLAYGKLAVGALASGRCKPAPPVTAGVFCLSTRVSPRPDHAVSSHAAQDCTKGRREESTEFVPEALKNMLLVMAAQQVLTPDWQVSCPASTYCQAQGRTYLAAAAVSFRWTRSFDSFDQWLC